MMMTMMTIMTMMTMMTMMTNLTLMTMMTMITMTLTMMTMMTMTLTLTITMTMTMSQGLAHWMSVMAEHMNHESSLHPAYMWHNGIDQKMSLTEQQQLLQKGGWCFDNISGGGRIFGMIGMLTVV